LSILKKFSCDIEKFTLIYGLFPSEAFALNTKSGIITNIMTITAFDIYKREVFDIFKVVKKFFDVFFCVLYQFEFLQFLISF
jgi:hypothetical protein